MATVNDTQATSTEQAAADNFTSRMVSILYGRTTDGQSFSLLNPIAAGSPRWDADCATVGCAQPSERCVPVERRPRRSARHTALPARRSSALPTMHKRREASITKQGDTI